MNTDNLFHSFASVASHCPTKVLLRDADGRAWTYGDMLNESARVANALVALGLVPGDRVSVQVEKSVANLWLYLGALRAGLVYHPLNPAYTPEEMRFFVGDAEPSLLICEPHRLQTYQEIACDFDVAHVMTLHGADKASFNYMLAGASDQFDTVARRANDLAALIHSSGTTGRPKGIMLTHGNLLSNAETLADFWGFTEDDTLLHALPIFHVHGLFVATHCVLISGSDMVWLPSFDVDAVLTSLPRSTVMMGVPTYYARLLNDERFSREHCTQSRLFISGSAPLLEQTFSAFLARTGHTILERYGMSETGMNSSNPLLGERRPGTVGPPLPGTEIRIVDGNRRPVPEGDIGAIEVRGPNVFAGYWRMPERTAADIDVLGWFATGDLGCMDEFGYLSIVGRAKDLVISGGLNVYPKEVERVVDGVDGVGESAVFGVPHPDWGEAVVAAVVPSENSQLDEAALLATIDKSLARFKQPKRIQFVDELPRNAMGKVQKNRLRKEWTQSF